MAYTVGSESPERGPTCLGGRRCETVLEYVRSEKGASAVNNDKCYTTAVREVVILQHVISSNSEKVREIIIVLGPRRLLHQFQRSLSLVGVHAVHGEKRENWVLSSSYLKRLAIFILPNKLVRMYEYDNQNRDIEYGPVTE